MEQSRKNEHIPITILRNIRQIFIHPHQDTIDTRDESFTCPDNDPYLSPPRRYPFCDPSSHRSNSLSPALTKPPPILRENPFTAAHLLPPFPHVTILPSHRLCLPLDRLSNTCFQQLRTSPGRRNNPSMHIVVLSKALVLQLRHPPLTQQNIPPAIMPPESRPWSNTIYPLMQTGPSPPFPIAVCGNAQPTDPPFHLPTSVPRPERSYQMHSGIIHVLPTSVNPSSLTVPQELFVSSLSVPPAAALVGGMHRLGYPWDLSLATPIESHDSPESTENSTTVPRLGSSMRRSIDRTRCLTRGSHIFPET